VDSKLACDSPDKKLEVAVPGVAVTKIPPLKLNKISEVFRKVLSRR
jgi:hypothetical protein